MFIIVPIIFILYGSLIFITAHFYKISKKKSTRSIKKNPSRSLNKTELDIQKVLPNLLPEEESDYYDADYFRMSGIGGVSFGLIMLLFYLADWIKD